MSALASSAAHSPQGVDALRELASIGSGHALTSLSRLARGARFNMEVPAVRRSARAHDISRAKSGTLVALDVGGSAPLRFVLVFDERAALRLAAQLIGKPAVSMGALEESALLELGNIMSCACLDAVARLTGTTLVPGTPTARHGALGDILRDELLGSPRVVLSTRFSLEGTKIGGRILLVAADSSAEAWARRLGAS